jgi:hypothetical protein
VHKEMKCMVQEEALFNMGHEVENEDQVSNFLLYCLKLLSELDVVKMFTHMLESCMGEEGRVITT